ncbi:unnamed protein product [marine sediment metagenome]|uniref:Uncharacterized protein n=1 Tax=marine sediment metagenome TaxID=412755 RepID=X1GSQ7_9ZZZZ
MKNKVNARTLRRAAKILEKEWAKPGKEEFWTIEDPKRGNDRVFRTKIIKIERR